MKQRAASSAREVPLRVDLPGPKADRFMTSKVGIVAAIGFLAGVVWPRVIGVKIGPEVPGESKAPLAAKPETSGAASADVPEAPTLAGSAGGEVDKVREQRVVVSEGRVVDCRRKKGDDKQGECGTLKVDSLLHPKLAALATCPSGLGLEGAVSVAFSIDFDKSTLDVLEGEKSKLPSSTVKGLFKCLMDDLAGIEIDKVPHTFPRYKVRYDLAFYPPGKELPEKAAPDAEGGKPDEATAEQGLGRARVAWEKALLRKSAKDGEVVTRLPQGTRVDLLEKQGDWYRVKSGANEGWVHRQAIGK